MSDCLGGWDFFDECHEKILDAPLFVETKIFNTDAKILEINSKTELYQLYVTYSIYRERLGNRDEHYLTFAELQKI